MDLDKEDIDKILNYLKIKLVNIKSVISIRAGIVSESIDTMSIIL